MGSPDAEPCRNTNENQHRVTLKHRFEMQRYETSGPEFLDHFVIKLGGLNKYDSACTASEGHSCPMNNLTWIEALAHCDAINLTDSLDAETSCYDKEPNQYEKSCEDKDGVCPKDSELCICMKNSPGCKRVCVEYKVKEIYAENIHDCPGYRLPTEAEWEYAYRAGTVEALYSGEHPTPAQCDGCSTGDNAIVGDIAQHYCSPPIQNENQNHPGPSGRALPNRWGLYDLAGNAAEWTFDNYQDIAGSTWVIDPQGPPSGSRRTMRGGTLMENAREFRAASRYGISPSTRYKLHGFRCVKSNQNP
jgi:formylglycine-generating enzyme required for sulfatase activity